MEITSTEIQNNFGTYLKLAQFEDIYITRNGKRVGVLKPYIESPQEREEKAAYGAIPGMSHEEFSRLVANSDSRYELIDGQVYQLASPTYGHQRLAAAIYGQMDLWSQGKKCKPVIAPFDVTLIVDERINVVQPDIAVVCDQENINETGRYSGTPTLVVEVLSPSTRSIDLIKKLNLYMRAGVKEYWIISIENQEAYLYDFMDNDIQDYRVIRRDEEAMSKALDGLTVKLMQVFAV